MTDSLTIPYQYKVLLLGLFSYTSCSVIAGALLLGLLTKTLVVTTFLAIVVTLIYEHRIRKTTHLKNTTETPLLLPLTTLPYSYGQLTGDLKSLKQACQNALAHNHTIRITLPALDHTPFLEEGLRHYGDNTLITIETAVDTIPTGTLAITFEQGPTTKYVQAHSLTELNTRVTTLTRHGWTTNEKATVHASLLTGPLYIQQLQYRTAPMGSS